jgi:hypothetical protein
VKWRAALSPLASYNVIFGPPVWDVSTQRSGGSWNGRRLKLQLVSKRKDVGRSALTRTALLEGTNWLWKK